MKDAVAKVTCQANSVEGTVPYQVFETMVDMHNRLYLTLALTLNPNPNPMKPKQQM